VIVVDANILVYSLVVSEHQTNTMRLREKGPDWRVPGLCLHEVHNVLVTMERQGFMTQDQRYGLLSRVEQFMQVAESPVDLSAALANAARYRITGYDAQYVTLAQGLGVPLITEDRRLRTAVPDGVLTVEEFLAE
jgi:predicted nucleic acid-binding protein